MTKVLPRGTKAEGKTLKVKKGLAKPFASPYHRRDENEEE